MSFTALKRNFQNVALILALALVSAAAHADYDVTIGAGASANGSWSGASPDVWTPSASGATVSATEIQTRLAAGTPVTITTRRRSRERRYCAERIAGLDDQHHLDLTALPLQSMRPLPRPGHRRD
jgi:hypothetical protein